MNVMQVVKEHPIPVGIGVLVLLLLMRSGGSSSGGANLGALSLQSQQIASSTNVALAGVNADVTKANIAGTVQMAGINASTIQANNKAYSDMYMANLYGATEMAKSSDASLVSVFTQSMNHADNQSMISAQRDVQLAQIQSQFDTVASNNQTQLSALQMQIAGSSSLTDKLIGADQYKTNQMLSFENANLPTLLQHSENLAQISGNTATAIANINSNTTLQTVAMNTSAQRTTAEANANATNVGTVTGAVNSLGGLGGIINSVGSIASSIGGIFGF